MINRPQIKADARLLIRTAAVSPLAVSAVVLLITFVLERVSDLAEYGSLFYTYTYNAAYMEALMEGDVSALPTLLSGSPDATFFSILIGLFTTILYAGYYAYCIGIRKGVRMPYWTLLDGLSISGKLIWCNIQMAVKTLLWSMLFLIPGLIAMYRYRFAIYNLLTYPELTASEAILLSCRQTSGMKLSLFILDLSFLGWLILPGILSNLFSWMGLYPLAILASIAIQIWLTPYTTLCDLAYYEEAQRRMAMPPSWNNANY